MYHSLRYMFSYINLLYNMHRRKYELIWRSVFL